MSTRAATRAADLAPAQLPVDGGNPLLKLFEVAPPALLATLVLAQLKALAPDAQSTRWIDELLADPRLDSVDGARPEVVRTLLGFGHPWALTISPEELARFRASRPGGTGRWNSGHAIMALGSALGIAGTVMSLRVVGESGLRDLISPTFVGIGLSLLAGSWAGTVFLRAAVGWEAVSRTVLRFEVPLALACFGALSAVNDFRNALGLVAAAVPIGIAALVSEFTRKD